MSYEDHKELFRRLVPPVTDLAYVCHLWRTETAKSKGTHEVAPDQSCRAGNWAQGDSMSDSYFRLSMPMDHIRQMAAHPRIPRTYFVERAVLKPTQV